ncbi:putative nuclease HARBI1 [Cucumis melo var. makuwa]|uniref:Nuclease HARBI1 n=1 Tax=Cucumis melo var. makuwa TaxID=1194695 RepID=A0A5A7TFF9_CUCMM|nr:putative nuclease HARBI1 [Cucumis melo var. makuwa]TYK26739.1 putative nuclease HARBI1 [Cucumis melo var. makuwa]
MDRRYFDILCHLLRTIAGLTSTEVVNVEEMVAMFLHILTHDNFLCALDGTYIKVNISAGDRPRGFLGTLQRPTLPLAGMVWRRQCTFNVQRVLQYEDFFVPWQRLNQTYDELSYVFGKDRTIGGRAKTFWDVGSNDSAGYTTFRIDATLDMEF